MFNPRSLTVSPFRPSYLQPPAVHPKNNRFITPLFSASSELPPSFSNHCYPLPPRTRRATKRANNLQNQHLQKCVKTNDFKSVQNEHLCKTRGRGAHLCDNFALSASPRYHFSGGLRFSIVAGQG